MTEPAAAGVRPSAADVAVALLLAALAAALYAATSLGRIYGNDGAMLADWTALPERAYWQYHNTLYLPAARLVDAVLPRGLLVAADDPLAVAKALSILAAAAGIALTYGCCRLLGIPRAASAVGTVLLAVSPVTWFFGAAIEVHALHFAVVSACALVTLAAPWRRPVLATALTAIVFLLPYLSHQSAPVLGPGWLLLVQCARKRTGEPFRLPVLAVIGGVLVLSLLVGHALVQWRCGKGFGPDPLDVAAKISGWRRTFTWNVVNEALLAPLCALVPVAIAAMCWRRADGMLRACAALTLVPLCACILWWGIPERGGYVLGPAFLLAALAAAAWARLPRAAAIATAIVVIGLQGWAGFRFVSDFDREGSQLDDRVARIRALLGDDARVLSANDNAPMITAWLPRAQELNLFGEFAKELAKETPVDVWLRDTEPGAIAIGTQGRFVLDTSYRLRTDVPERVHQYLNALEDVLKRAFRVTEHPHASWPLWLVEPKS